MSERHEENSERAARWNSHLKSNPVSAPSVVEEPGQFPELAAAAIVEEKPTFLLFPDSKGWIKC